MSVQVMFFVTPDGRLVQRVQMTDDEGRIDLRDRVATAAESRQVAALILLRQGADGVAAARAIAEAPAPDVAPADPNRIVN